MLFAAPMLLTVYPRVGGGTCYRRPEVLIWLGLSPRGRGNRIGLTSTGRVPRSIPAWAGEPRRSVRLLIAGKVYPRVGGGTMDNEIREELYQGLSPRGRGNPLSGLAPFSLEGSIPAWAGEPIPGISPARRGKVYPRVGGGTLAHVRRFISRRGLSPRGRGNPNPT